MPTKPLTNVRKLRRSQGMTQLQLAAQADLTINTVKKIESSNDARELGRVETWTWRKLSEVLKVKVSEIYPSLGI